MDILSHGLWATTVARAYNLDAKEPVKLRRAFLWGMFPDLFAFGIPFVYRLFQILTGTVAWNAFRPPPENGQSIPMYDLSHTLYNYSHSLIIFGIVFGLVWWFRQRRPPRSMLGWFLHIICDVPTHTYAFFPTPVFFPAWNWMFDGMSWAQPWFLALDYGLLIAVNILVSVVRARRQRKIT
jgi:hypothetical protein